MAEVLQAFTLGCFHPPKGLQSSKEGTPLGACGSQYRAQEPAYKQVSLNIKPHTNLLVSTPVLTPVALTQFRISSKYLQLEAGSIGCFQLYQEQFCSGLLSGAIHILSQSYFGTFFIKSYIYTFGSRLRHGFSHIEILMPEFLMFMISQIAQGLTPVLEENAKTVASIYPLFITHWKTAVEQYVPSSVETPSVQLTVDKVKNKRRAGIILYEAFIGYQNNTDMISPD